MVFGQRLKPMGVNELGGGAAIQRSKAVRSVKRILLPIMQVHQVQVVAGRQNPPKAGLPTHGTGDEIILDVVGQLNPGAELGVGNDPVQTVLEAPFLQIDSIPLVLETDHHSGTGTNREIDGKFLAGS